MHYTRCPECPGVNACIPCDGPEDADLLFIGEAPGPQEDKVAKKRPPGKPFIGRSGEEVDQHYLPLAGLRRSDVRFTNAIRCLPISSGGKLNSARSKDVELLDTCAAHHLYPGIEAGNYRCLVPLGSFACRAICPDVDLDLQHGMPVMTRWGIPAFPMYHPALGMHEPKKMLHIRTDWHRLRSFLSGRLTVPVDQYPDPDYQEVTDAREILQIDQSLPLAGDTETTRQGEPFCLTYSQAAGTGRLIRAERTDLLTAFTRRVSSHGGPILFHNWLFDWPVTEAMGVTFPVSRVMDTMAVVFHLGNLPQGLKALSRRELGMLMQDFDDLVSPHSRVQVLEYYHRAQEVEWAKPDPELVRQPGGLLKLYQPQSIGTKLKRFFTDFNKDPGKDIFGAWANWEAHQIELEEKVGPYPGKCITHVPFGEILHYACRDADALIRLWPILRRMKSQVRRKSQELWRS